MSGVALTTISPFSTSSSLSTPCVDGCCGPIEIVIWVSSGRSTISDCGGMFTAELINSVNSERLSVKRKASYSRLVHSLLSLFTLHFLLFTFHHSLFQAVRLIASQRKILAQGMALPVVG